MRGSKSAISAAEVQGRRPVPEVPLWVAERARRRRRPARRLDQQLPAVAPAARLAQVRDELYEPAISYPEGVEGILLRDQAVADLDLRILGLIGPEDAV